MDLRSQLQKYRQEHDEILRFLKVWENALNLAESQQDTERRRGLADLREMEKTFERIRQHSNEEEENLESPYGLYLEDGALQKLGEEHELLIRWNSDFCRELRFATIVRTDEVVALGRQLLEMLRHHIVYEEGLLKQIQDEKDAEEKLLLKYTESAE